MRLDRPLNSNPGTNIVLSVTDTVGLISRDEKVNASAVWGPLRLGAPGPGPPGPLDKTALVTVSNYQSEQYMRVTSYITHINTKSLQRAWYHTLSACS